jgi:hypothetical protein
MSEADNTLFSTASYKIFDLLGDGPFKGFVVKSGAYGTDPLVSTYYDDVPIRNLDGSYNYDISGAGFTFDYMLGTSTQTGITGFQKVESVIPLSSNTRVANPPAGAGPWKPVIASFNTNTYPDADTVKITMEVPALLAQDPKTNNINPFNVTYEIDICLNNGEWVTQPVTPGDSSTLFEIRGKCTSPYQRIHVFTLPKTDPPSIFNEWKIRVRRVSQNVLLMGTQNELFVKNISVVSSNRYAYPNSVMVATTISSEQFSTVPTRAYEMDGMLVNVPNGYTPTDYPVTGGIVPATYPNIWLGDFSGNAWTDNPAWIYYDLLTNSVHGLGEYIASGSVDKWTLYEIAQYCDEMVDDGAGGYEPNFTCNVSIQQPDDAYTVLLNLASTFRGMLYYANGTIHAVQTTNKTPFTIFTNANVVNGQFSYSDTAQNTRATVAMVKWVDPDNGYRENVEYIEDLEGIQRYGYQEKQVTAFASTSKGQAYRFGRWILETERLLTETVTFQTDMEGLALRPGEAFGVYDNFRNNLSQGGRIVGLSTGRSLITLDRYVTYDPALVYSLTAIVPKQTLDDVTDVTGSNQISSIMQSQIESFEVIDPGSTRVNQLLIQGSYSSSVFIGSPWILSASGTTEDVFDSATFYTCLATAEVEPGKIEVLGLEANTGINFVIQTGYTTESYPVNAGDSTSISAPHDFTVVERMGTAENGVFYDVLYASWQNSNPSPNLSHYVLSGKTFSSSYAGVSVFGMDYNWPRTITGQYDFKVASVSLGGMQSAFKTASITITDTNPMGTMLPLSGIQIIEDYDPLYATSSGKTGYIGLTPTFSWANVENADGTPITGTQFISGYKLYFQSYDGLTDYVTPFTVSGLATTEYEVPTGFIYGFAGGAQRGFKFRVDTVDIYGNVALGASLPVNNPPMKPPFSSGFVGYNGGVQYNITPSLQYDTSGVYLWVDQSPSFSPSYSNFDYQSSNLAGNANIAPDTGSFYTWFALGDTWGAAGNPIWGPISGNADQMFGTTFTDVSAEINYAFGLLTGSITDLQAQITGLSGTTLLWVEGLSGSFADATGNLYTAMSVQLEQVMAKSGFATATQVNAVQVSLNDDITATGATILTVIASTGANAIGASAEYTQDVSANITGIGSNVQVLASAFVTGGGANPLAAKATWGFQLKADGHASSLVATSTSFSDIGDLVLGNMNIQSDTYTPGVAGWQINSSGTAEFANASVRGAFTGGAGAALVSMNDNGITIGNPSAARVFLEANSPSLDLFGLGNYQSVALANLAGGNSDNFGSLRLYSGASATAWARLEADFGGVLSLGNGMLIARGSDKSLFFHALTNGTYITESNGLQLYGDVTHPVQVKGADLNIDNDCSAVSFNATSSRRFKDNIRPLSSVMELLQRLNPVTFDWKPEIRDFKDDIGLIAEEVYDVVPSVVKIGISGQVEGLDYGRLNVLSIEAIKELDDRLRRLEGR